MQILIGLRSFEKFSAVYYFVKQFVSIFAQELRIEIWLELQKLYGLVGERDVTFSLVELMQGPAASEEEGTGSRIQDAVTAELSGDYQSAFKIYEDLVIQADENDVACTAAEYCNWENGRLRCLSLLQKWKPLLEAVTSEVVRARGCAVYVPIYLQ